jgi:hypothetical protein
MKIEFTKKKLKAQGIALGENFIYAEKVYTRVRLLGSPHDCVYGLELDNGVNIVTLTLETVVMAADGAMAKPVNFSDLDPGDCFMIQGLDTVFMKILSQGAPAALCLASGRVQPTTIHVNGSNQDIYGINVIPVQITGMVTPGEK